MKKRPIIALLIAAILLAVLGGFFFAFSLISYRITDQQYKRISTSNPKTLSEFEKMASFRKREIVAKTNSGWHSGVRDRENIYRYYISFNDCIDVVVDENGAIDAILPVYE